jgi:Rps23 Pro-64 3,4-dihydroxylase Tpa1-like proline 4-hydroxylase
MNDGGNNFSNIRNSEINRIGPKYISPMFYNKYGVHDKMKDFGAYENEKYITNFSPIWKRGDKYQHKRMNKRVNLNYDKQYCIINDAINEKRLVELYKNPRNDFLFLSNKMTHEELYQKLESLGFDKMKCYSFTDCSYEQLVNYFKMLYVNDNCEHYIFEKKNVKLIITESDNNNDILLWDKIDVGRLAKEFYSGKPFKHIVLDKVINEDLLELAYKEITSISKNNFFNTIVIGMPEVQVNKYALTNFDGLKYIVQIKNYLESDYFLKILEKVTGIDNLQKDPTNNGGGLHFINYNGKLNIHSDFNRHKASKKYRRLNLLLYLNKDYKEEYNGHFEFWNKDMTSCEKKIAPLFNRIVLFKVDDNANHGHPELWKNPNNSRMSLAIYYYTNDRPEHEKSETYHARWKTLQVPKQLTNDTEVLERENIVDEKPKCYITHLTTRYDVLNTIIDTYNYNSYLEIGVENGFTFKNIKLDMSKKVGVDPDPTYKEDNIILKTSDNFFKENNKIFDIIFIDGMHQLEYVYNDFFNAIHCLTPNGSIVIDDVLPMNEREQYKVPIKHYYNNGILKYGWTGDVWKFVYFLFQYYQFDFSVYNFTAGYRGIIHIYNFKNEINDDIDNTKVIETMNSYDYNKDYDKYLKYINEYCKNS